MEFHVLGPLEVMDEGRPVAVTAPRQRALLAVLLVHANEVVSTDRLLDLVWGEEQPDVSALRYQISKLREALSDDAIETRSPGYVIHAEREQLDALQFDKLLAEARNVAATDAGRAIEILDEALGLWRGDPYADFTYEEFAAPEIRRLAELRLEAIETRFDALLAQGRDQELVGDLQALVQEHPRREGLAASLMLALYRSGRQADALAAFQKLRTELGEELGIEPSQELVDLEGRMLLQDDSLAVEAAPPAADYLRGYILRGRIGEGAHGVVWRAAQPGVGREVAIKAIHPDIANRPGFVRRFEMEAQLVASLEHPHIVSLFDFWRDPEGAYLVMPHLRGGNVAGLVRQGPLLPEAALELIEAVGGALSYAHRRGVVHRDVTPQNVLLDDDGHPYLADFGVAALIGETAGPSSSSPAYLAPEQHAGAGAVPASDVYSLGVLAHSVLTGEIPVVNERLHLVSRLNPDIPAAVDDAIARATAVDVAERYLDPADFVAGLAASLNGGGRSAPAVARDVRNPYKGLRAFSEADSPDFFGRDVVVSELIDAVARDRLVAVVGPSGCGKSSLVRAGLIADLRRGALPGSERWLVTDMYPGARPRNELEEALLRVAVERPTDLYEQLARDDVGTVLGGLLPRDAELLLVVDQFEELFTLTTDEEERRRFLAILGRMATDTGSRLRVIVTLRADFFDRPLEYAGFGDLMRRGLVSVTVPNEDSLAQAIIGPAESVGLSVEPGLERVITRDVADQPGGLPLLEFALTELFHQRDGDELTAAGYQRTGGVLGALGRRAEDLFGGCDDDERDAIRQVFLRLVTVEEGAEDTRRRIPLTDLHEIGIESETLQRVLDDYGTHRLITFDRDPETRVPTVEVAHEALLSRWNRLRSWIDERRDDLVLHRRLAAAVREWHDSEWSPAYLFSGGRLDHYETFAEETDIALTDPERGFLTASRVAEDEMLARRRRRRLGVLAAFASAAVIAAVLAVVAFAEQRNAEDASAEAQENQELAEQHAADLGVQTAVAEEQTALAQEQAAISRIGELASQSRVEFDQDPELAILLALEAVSVPRDGNPPKEAVDTLHFAVSESRARFTVPGHLRAGINGDGSRLLSATRGEDVVLYDTATGKTLLTLPVPAGFGDEDSFGEIAMAISSDGMRLATGRSDGTISLWDAVSGEEMATTNDVQTISVNATEGAFTLAYGETLTNPIDVDSTGADIESELEALREVDDVTIAGAGTLVDPWQVTFVDTASPYVRRLDVDSAELGPGTGAVAVDAFGAFAEISMDADSGTFVFSLDGVLSAPLAVDVTAEQIEAALEDLPGMPDVLVSGGAGFFELGSASDGVLLPAFAAASVDLATPGSVTVQGRGHDYPGEDIWSDGVIELEFSRNGLILVSRSYDQTIRVWDTTTLEQLTLIDFWIGQRSTWGIALDVDATRVAAASADGTRVWDTTTGELLHELFSETGMNAWDVDFFPDGDRLAVAYVDPEQGLGIWDLATETEHPVYGLPLSRAVSVSVDGSRIAVGDDGGLISVVEPLEFGGRQLFTLDGHRNRLMDISFADEGLTMVSVSDHSARLWDVGASGTAEWMTLGGEAWSIPSVAYSPDGSLLVRGPVGLSIIVADATTGAEVAALGIASPEVPDMAFSPDGSLLAAGAHGESGAVLVWDTATWEPVASLASPVEDGADGFAWSVDFSPDGSRLAATVDGRVEIWDTSTWEQLYSLAVPDSDQGEYMELAFRPNGEELAVRGTVLMDGGTPDDPDDDYWDDAVEIYDLDGKYLRTCCQHYWFLYVASVDYSPDGSQLLTAGFDYETGEGTVFTWDADSGALMQSFEGHDDVAWDAVFSPDGSLIAASGDPDVRLWDAATGDEVLELIHGAGVILEVIFSPDGSRLVSTADTNGLTRVWALELDDLIQIANDRLTRTFTEAECEIYQIESCPLEE